MKRFESTSFISSFSRGVVVLRATKRCFVSPTWRGGAPRKGVWSTGRTTCRELPPAATPAPLVRHRQSRERRGLVRHQMALSIVAVTFGKKGGHPSSPGLPQFLPYNRRWSNPGPPGYSPFYLPLSLLSSPLSLSLFLKPSPWSKGGYSSGPGLKQSLFM